MSEQPAAKPDLEARDAYLGVVVDLPNGQTVTGKPIPYGDAMRIMALSEQWSAGGNPKETLIPVLQAFHELTGITQAELSAKDPTMTLGEVLDLINRFFFHRRPGPTVPSANGGTAPSAA